MGLKSGRNQVLPRGIVFEQQNANAGCSGQLGQGVASENGRPDPTPARRPWACSS
jgi:hypothetical protein